MRIIVCTGTDALEGGSGGEMCKGQLESSTRLKLMRYSSKLSNFEQTPIKGR